MNQPQQYSQGYVPQQPQIQMASTPQPLQNKTTQDVRIYKSSFLFFSSAAGRFQRDCVKMTNQGWRLHQVSFVGLDFFLRRIVCAIYEK